MESVIQSFEQDVLQASHALPILVDFWAEWCGPCRVLGPTLERLEEEAEGQWRLVKINVDEFPEIAQQHRVQGIPAVKLFHQGREVAEFVGALQESQVRDWLDQHVPSETKQVLETARQALADGRNEEASSLLDRVLAEHPSDAEARVLLARMRFADDPAAAAEQVKDIGPGDPMWETADAINALCRLVQLTEPTDSGDAEAWDIYLHGTRALGEGRYADALERWIEVLNRRARDVDDDGARKACIAVFRLLGEEHPITRQYRRQFSSALF
jgi:putative thioredoxin